MSIRIGHASISENGGVNGQPGDQTGKEVCIREWYQKDWKFVLRPLSSDVAERSATFVEASCANDNIGYGWDLRNTAAQAAAKVGWDASKITTKVNTDCSRLMDDAATAAGVRLTHYRLADGTENGNTTSTMRAAFTASNAYRALDDKKYLTSPDYLLRGDILVSDSHTVMVLDNGSKAAQETVSPQAAANAPMTGKQIKVAYIGYTDALPESGWSVKEGAWARFTAAGIVNGLHPQSPITREEMVAVMDRVLRAAGITL